MHVAQLLASAGRGNRAFGVGDRQRAGLIGRQLSGAVGREELDVALRPAEAAGIALSGAWRRPEAAPRDRTPAEPPARAALREFGDRPRALTQGIVDLAAQLGPHRDVDADRDAEDHDRDGQPGGPGDAAAKGQGSRST